MQVPRIYVDTSVFGGCFDREFESESRQLVGLIADRRIHAVISDLVVEELELAPFNVRSMFASLPSALIDRVPLGDDTRRVARAYVELGVLTERSWNDARHLAAATLARVDAVASWNFRDIVNLSRMRGFNATNISLGFDPLTILSPNGICVASESTS